MRSSSGSDYAHGLEDMYQYTITFANIPLQVGFQRDRSQNRRHLNRRSIRTPPDRHQVCADQFLNTKMVGMRSKGEIGSNSQCR